MIYSVFLGMCHYAFYISCAPAPVNYDDIQSKTVQEAVVDVDYCNFLYNDLGRRDSTCEAICVKWDFYLE